MSSSSSNNKKSKGNSNSNCAQSNQYIFFWRGNSPMSQWFPSEFVLDGITYSCAEQYMMHQKALLFGDTEVAERILATRSPRDHQKLGRIVSNFNESLWLENCEQIVYRGNMAKFSQNEYLYDLISCVTMKDKEFVEASPVDCLWGIGLDEATARRTDPSKWRGKNLLGKILTRVRDDLLSVQKN